PGRPPVPYTTLFRSRHAPARAADGPPARFLAPADGDPVRGHAEGARGVADGSGVLPAPARATRLPPLPARTLRAGRGARAAGPRAPRRRLGTEAGDRKSVG